MTRRNPQRQLGLEVRMLTVMALVGLVYAGIGWGLHLLGMSTPAIIVLAGAVLAAQWLSSERFALAATKAREVDRDAAWPAGVAGISAGQAPRRQRGDPTPGLARPSRADDRVRRRAGRHGRVVLDPSDAYQPPCG
jgi:hypothetical protein